VLLALLQIRVPQGAREARAKHLGHDVHALLDAGASGGELGGGTAIRRVG
jgi:hypothetical protein